MALKEVRQRKTRPWVLVGASPINLARSTVIAVPLSTQAPEETTIKHQRFILIIYTCALY